MLSSDGHCQREKTTERDLHSVGLSEFLKYIFHLKCDNINLCFYDRLCCDAQNAKCVTEEIDLFSWLYGDAENILTLLNN